MDRRRNFVEGRYKFDLTIRYQSAAIIHEHRRLNYDPFKWNCPTKSCVKKSKVAAKRTTEVDNAHHWCLTREYAIAQPAMACPRYSGKERNGGSERKYGVPGRSLINSSFSYPQPASWAACSKESLIA